MTVPQDPIRRDPYVLSKYNRSRTSLYRDIADGRFPAPVRTGPHSIGWFDSTLQAHDAALKEAAS